MKAALLNGFKSLAGRLEGSPRPPRHALEVVAMHSTPADRLSDFRTLVHYLSGLYTPFDPQHLTAYFGNPEAFASGPYLLFTFDDGLANNLASARVLSELGHKAIYFIVPDFHTSPHSEEYYRTYIRPVIDTRIDHSKEDRSAMTVADLKELQSMGHSIGCHSKTHRMHAGMSDEEMQVELEVGKKTLEALLDTGVEFFASPNNTFLSVNPYAARLVADSFKAHFVTFPGNNHTEGSLQMIFRRNIEVHWNMGRIKYALGAWDLWRWRRARHQYRELFLPQAR